MCKLQTQIQCSFAIFVTIVAAQHLLLHLLVHFLQAPDLGDRNALLNEQLFADFVPIPYGTLDSHQLLFHIDFDGLAVAVPQPVSPVATVPLAHTPDHNPLAVPLIVQVLALVVRPVGPVKFPLAIQPILLPLASVCLAVGPGVDPLPLHLACHEVAYVLLRENGPMKPVQDEIKIQNQAFFSDQLNVLNWKLHFLQFLLYNILLVLPGPNFFHRLEPHALSFAEQFLLHLLQAPLELVLLARTANKGLDTFSTFDILNEGPFVLVLSRFLDTFAMLVATSPRPDIQVSLLALLNYSKGATIIENALVELALHLDLLLGLRVLGTDPALSVQLYHKGIGQIFLSAINIEHFRNFVFVLALRFTELVGVVLKTLDYVLEQISRIIHLLLFVYLIILQIIPVVIVVHFALVQYYGLEAPFGNSLLLIQAADAPRHILSQLLVVDPLANIEHAQGQDVVGVIEPVLQNGLPIYAKGCLEFLLVLGYFEDEVAEALDLFG